MTIVRRETMFLLLGDLLLLVFSLWLALLLRLLHAPTLPYFLRHFWIFLPVFGISIGVFFIAGLYEKQTRLVKRIMGSRILSAQIANTIIAAIIFFLLPVVLAPKTILILYLIISVFLILIWRLYITPRVSLQTRQLAVLVGTGEAVRDVFEEVNGNNRYHIRFVEHIDTSVVDSKGISEQIRKSIADGARTLVIDTRDNGVHGELPALYDAMVSGILFVEFATFYEELFDRVPIKHIDYVWLFGCLPKKHLLYDFGKRVFDIVGASVGIIVAMIFIVPAALILLLDGGTPFIFHDRIGRSGKIIRIAKLRTMLFNDNGDPVLREKNRVTAFGTFLRKTRIDELPQLVNVLAGELSFIGPRPEFPQLARVYEQEIPFYETRHVITPGLSGWAQIRDYNAPRHSADVERTKNKLSYDLYYLKHRSFGLDVVIALKTIRAIISFSGV